MAANCGPNLTCGDGISAPLQACVYYVPSSCTHCHHMSPEATGHRCVGGTGKELDQAMTKAFQNPPSDDSVPYIVKPTTIDKDNRYTDIDKLQKRAGIKK